MNPSDLLPRVFDLLRITLELRSPLTVGASEGDDLSDHSCVADANGLPSIPGSSIAGVLRHALAQGDPDRDPGIRALFGFQESSDGASSRLWTSWAQVHDSRDRPFPVRATTEAQHKALASDPVLLAVRKGMVRDHVRISSRGAPANRAKFETWLVPTGARFSFELGIAVPDDKKLRERFSADALLACLMDTGMRLGGRSRRGFGAFRLHRVLRRRFDLGKDREAWCRLPRDLSADVPKDVLKPMTEAELHAVVRSTPSKTATAILFLTPEDLFLPGGGDPGEFASFAKLGAEAVQKLDRVPLTERVLRWEGGQGKVADRPRLVLPATGIKGALRHRVAFHARCIEGAFVDRDDPRKPDDLDLDRLLRDQPAEPGAAAVRALFGSARGEQDEPGRVFVEDIPWTDRPWATLQHVSLDRFSGGPMDGLLFGEAALGGPQVVLVVRVARPETLPETATRALCRALRDLREGRLALGAAASRGHGYFQGEVAWADAAMPFRGES